MQQTEFVGYLMVYGVILIVALIAIIKHHNTKYSYTTTQ